MPLSKFAVSIAHSLTDYFTLDNTTPLDVSDSIDMAQQAIGTVARAISASVTYFWSRPAPPPANRYGATPPQFQSTGSGVGGKGGLERAMTLARLFEVVFDEAQLTYALSANALSGGVYLRRSALLTDAFNAVDPGNKLQNQITHEDCKHILQFVEKRREFFPSRSANRLLITINTALNITSNMVEEEKKALTRGPITLPDNAGDDDDDGNFVMIPDNCVNNYDNSKAPADLWNPEEAVFKVIYDRTTTLMDTLHDEFISPVSARSNPSSNSTPVSNTQRSSTDSIFRA